MVSQNQKIHHCSKMDICSVSELDFPPIIDPEAMENCSTTVNAGASSFSSMTIPHGQSGDILPFNWEMEEESNLRSKRLKLMPSTQQCFYLEGLSNLSPLGLTLKKTPSFLNLLETKLSHVSESRKEAREEATAREFTGKTKASNFSASLLRIGSWERVSRHEGELVAKCYYAKRKLVWEVLDTGLKNKIEFQWSDIAAVKAHYSEDGPDTLEIELSRRPLFFRETNPQPRKHTLWKATVDFTGGQASCCRRHFLQFPQGTLQKHHEKLLRSDDRLSLLSKEPYPTSEFPFFEPENEENQSSAFEEHSTNLLQKFFDWDTMNNHLQNFTLSRSSSVLQQLPNPEFPITCSRTASPTLVENVVNDRNEQQTMTTQFGSTAFARTGDCKDMSNASISIPNSSPAAFCSSLPSILDFSADSYHYMGETKASEVAAQLRDVVGILDRDQGKLNPRMNTHGSPYSNFSSPMSNMPSEWNLMFPFNPGSSVGGKSEINGYFTCGLSYPEEVTTKVQREISAGTNADFMANISINEPYPVFSIENPAMPEEI